MIRAPQLLQQRDPRRVERTEPTLRTERPALKRDARRPTETLEQFVAALEKHQWSNFTNSYCDFCTRFKEEDRLFARAMQLGPRGVDAFHQAREEMISGIVHAAVRQAQQNTAEMYKQRIAEMREKFMRPIDHFKEKLDRHDWTYEYSDDNKSWKAAAANENLLIAEALAGGDEFIEAFKARYNQAFTDGRFCPWDHMVRRHKANNPGKYAA
jgi:hypothetical protein